MSSPVVSSENKNSYSLSQIESIMLDDFYEKMLASNNKNKVTIPTPEVKVQNKKTFVANFRTLAKKLNREENLLLDFLRKEIGSDISVSENGEMIISNILRQPQIESLLKRFIVAYVQCPQCKYLGTELMKKAGKTTLTCGGCKASCSIS